MSLFCCHNNSPLKFDIVGLSDKEMREIVEMVLQNGGEIRHAENQPIKFTKPFKFVTSAFPAAKLYDVEFIRECVRQGAIVDPSPYRIGTPLLYDDCVMAHFLHGPYVCCIRKLEMMEPIQGGLKAERRPYTPLNRTTNLSDDENILPVAQRGKAPKSKDRRKTTRTGISRRGRGAAMTAAEDADIMGYLIHHDLIREAARGMRVWNDMFEDGVCPTRTPHTLFKHFRYSILPNIEKYKLTDIQLKTFLNVKKIITFNLRK